MSKVRMSILFSSGSLYVFQLINLAFSMFIARALTPEEIGVYAIVAAISMSSSEFKLLGTGDYLIREQIDKEKIQNTLGVSIISSWIIGVLMLVLAIPLSHFFEQPDIQYLLYLLSIQFWLAPFNSINYALLRKEFDYVKNAAIVWGSRLLQFGSSVVLVLNGYSYFGLAMGMAIGSIVEFLLVLFLRSEKMQFVPRFNNLKPIVKFGSINTFANLIAQQAKLSYDLIIGKIGSPRDVAMYSRGNGLVDFVGHLTLGGLQTVALPYLSKEKTDIVIFRGSYLRASRLALSLLMPILVSAAVLKVELIYVLFGDQWNEAVALVPCIAIWYILVSFHPFAKQALITIGYEKQNLVIQFINFVAVVVNIFVFFEQGLVAITYGLIGVGVIYLILVTITLSKAIGLNWWQYTSHQYKNFAITIIAFLTAFLTRELLVPHYSEITVLICAGITLSLVWLLTVSLMKHEIIDEVRRLVGR